MKKPENIITDYTQVPATGSWGSYNETTKQWEGPVYSGSAVRQWIQTKLAYGPYDSIQEACQAIPVSMREGFTVGIRTEDGIVEYQWKKGTTNEDLVKKADDIISSAELIAPETLNFVDPPESITFQVQYSSKTGGRIYIKRDGIDIDQQNILPGLNTYTVPVPQNYRSYTYSIYIKDILGQDVVLTTNQFVVKVGTIKIISQIQEYLNTNVIGTDISSFITVSNFGNPVHLYLIQDGVTTQIPGTNFNSYLLTVNLNQQVGDHEFTLKAVSVNNDEEVVDEYDQQTFYYTKLSENERPYKIVIDEVRAATTAEKVTVIFHYQAYTVTQKQITFVVDGSTEIIPDTYFNSFQNNRYSISHSSLQVEGTHTIKLKIEDTESNTVQFIVYPYTIDENIISGSLFQFDPTQSEVSEGYYLDYSGIATGINGVDQENNVIRFSGESCATLKSSNTNLAVNPFALQSAGGGYTIELIYNTKCIGNLDAPVMSTFENESDTSLGVEITYKQISVGLGGASRKSVDVSENTWIHATVVFSTQGFVDDDITDGYMYIYVNGCMVYVQPLAELPSPNNNACLTLNVDNALQNFGECNIKLLRFYNVPLSPSQVVTNYVNSIDDPEQKQIVSGKNEADLPTVTFTEKEGTSYYFSDLLRQVDKSLQKVQLVNCITEFQESRQSPIERWEYTTVATQGTSTLQFPIKNFKIKIYNDGDYEKKGKPDTYNGDIIKQNGKNKKYVSLKPEDGWDKEYVFTLKCDYMESSHLNNTPTCSFFNNTVDDLVEDNENFPEWRNGDGSVSPSRDGYTGDGDSYRTYSTGVEAKRGYLDAIKGFPCVVKYIDRNNDEHYLGTYMFNLDKDANSLGFDAYHKNQNDQIVQSECVSIEGKSNTDEGAGSFCSFDYWLENKSGYNSQTQQYDPNNGYYSFEYNEYYIKEKNVLQHDLSFAEFIQYFAIEHPGEYYYAEAGNANKRHLISIDNQNSYYLQDFEVRHIYDDAYEEDPSNWHNWIETVQFISDSYETMQSGSVTSEQKQDIIDEFKQRFNLNYCLLYYLQMITFAQVDNAGKNCMWDTWGDGEQWYPRPYDQDTMAGLDNSGLEIIDPDVEYNRQGSPGNYVNVSASLTGAAISPDIDQAELDNIRYNKFNTSGSRMWVLFKQLFDREIKDLYRRLRDVKIYDAQNIIDFYFSQTSDIIGEKYYNKDSVAKFLYPIGSQTQYLDQLHGNRRERFKYWITTRIKFCDSLFEYNRVNSNLINLRINPTAPATLVFKTYNPIYIYVIVGTKTGHGDEVSADGEYHFFCSPKSQYAAGKEGVEITIPVTSGDKEVSIFGADSIKEIEGLSQLNCKLINLSNASKITTIELIGLRNLTSLIFGNNQYLRTLVAEGLTGVANDLDLTNASNINTVRISGSTFNNLLLTTENTGTTVKTIDVSGTAVQNIEIKQAPFLQSLNVANCSKLTQIILDTCNIPSLQFSDLVSLRKLNLINCQQLRTVNISNLSYFELDGSTFSNCRNLQEIIMTGVYNVNVNNVNRLSIESLIGLQKLNISETQGISEIGFDVDNLTTLTSLNVNGSQIVRLSLPKNSTLSYLNCNGCSYLTQVENINADIVNDENNNPVTGIFRDCYVLQSITGSKLKSNTANNIFRGCERLSTLDVTNIDFTNASDFTYAFFRCYELPWAPIKRVFNSSKNNIDLTGACAFRYHSSQKQDLDTIPGDIFSNLPNVKTLRCTFGFYNGGASSDNMGYSVPEGYVKYKAVETFTNTLSSCTTSLYLFAGSDIASIPSGFMSKLPNVETISNMFAATKITSIGQNIFQNNTAVKTANFVFANCTNVNNSISSNLLLDSMQNLTDAVGMFWNCGINGTVPRGFFKNNTKLKDTSVMFYKSKITGVGELFYNSANDYDHNKTYSLSKIDSMFGGSLLTGALNENIFTGCNSITSAGRYYGSWYATGNAYAEGGLFANTTITDVPDNIFHSLRNITTGQGMFYNCRTAMFPYEEINNQLCYKNFLSEFNYITNLNQMFAGCKNMRVGPLQERFIPSTATTINGIFAYTMLPNVISLNYLTSLTSAVGAYANTPISSYPADIFKNLRNLTNLSCFFQGCINLNQEIQDDLFEDCINLKNVSYMFQRCENLGNGASTDTLPAKLFKNNLLLETTAYMFANCYSMHGMINNIFSNSIPVLDEHDNPVLDEHDEPVMTEENQYINLVDIDSMFYRSCFIPNEDGYVFNIDFLHNLTRLKRANNTFYGLNRSQNSKNETSARFRLHDNDVFIKSPVLEQVSGIFQWANMYGTIDSNLFRYSLSSLKNISKAFSLTGVTAIEDNFLIPITGKNYTLDTVAYAFSSTPSLTSGNIPACNDKTLFSAMKNTNASFIGYAYNTGAQNASSFTNVWVSATGAPSGHSSVTYYTETDEFNSSARCLGL